MAGARGVRRVTRWGLRHGVPRMVMGRRARAGDLGLLEGWLRHEVPPARFSDERISISFNYAWSAKGPAKDRR